MVSCIYDTRTGVQLHSEFSVCLLDLQLGGRGRHLQGVIVGGVDDHCDSECGGCWQRSKGSNERGGKTSVYVGRGREAAISDVVVRSSVFLRRCRPSSHSADVTEPTTPDPCIHRYIKQHRHSAALTIQVSKTHPKEKYFVLQHNNWQYIQQMI